MKIYQGRVCPYSEADYLSEGMTPNAARGILAHGEPRHHRHRIYVVNGERRYELTRGTLHEDKVSWGYSGGGQMRAAALIAADLVEDVGSERDRAVEVVAEAKQTKLEDFDLPETSFNARLP